MSLNEQTFVSLHALPAALREHCERMISKTMICDEKNTKIFKTVSKFLTEALNLGITYEKSLTKLCDDFHTQFMNSINDDKLIHYCFLLTNSVMQFASEFKQKNLALNSTKITLDGIDANLKRHTNQTLESLTSSITAFHEKSLEYESGYRKYIKTSAQLATISNGERSDEEAFLAARKAEDKTLASFADLENILPVCMDKLKYKIKDSSEKEKASKIGLKTTIAEAARIFASERYKVDLESKLLNLDNSSDNFKILMDHLEKEAALEFTSKISLTDFELKFCSWYNFLKLDEIFDDIETRSMYSKMQLQAKSISPRIRIYIDLVLDQLFKTTNEFSKEICDEISFIMGNPKTSAYFMDALVLKKCTVLYEKLSSPIYLKKEQLSNLLTISQYFFLNCLSSKELNSEVSLNFLKFAGTVFSEHEVCFAESLSKVVILNDSKFWIELYALLNENEHKTSDIQLLNQGNQNLIFDFKNFVGSFMTTDTRPTREPEKNKAFLQVAEILFKVKLGFENTSDILISVSRKAKVQPDAVKGMLISRQDVFMPNISERTIAKAESKRIMTKLSKGLDKCHRLVLLLKKAVPYLDSADEACKLVLLSKHMYSKRMSLLKKILLNFSFIQAPQLRKQIFAQMIDPKHIAKQLKTSGQSNSSQIIGLDVKRTFCEHPSFSAEMLEQILNNISRPDVGNFPYYQGLNFVTNYFCITFDGDYLQSYNFTITLLRNKFSRFIDSELKNLKQLFYCLKKLIRVNMPELMQHIEHSHSLDLDAVFTGWCLTLFTSITQRYPQSSLLDEVVDIFIGEGWPGFIKVVISIFDSLAEKIVTLEYEEMLRLLTDIIKNNFSEVIKEEANRHRKIAPRGFNGLANNSLSKNSNSLLNFSFKQRIKQFPKINARLIDQYIEEYMTLAKKTEEFKQRVESKMKSAKRNSLYE